MVSREAGLFLTVQCAGVSSQQPCVLNHSDSHDWESRSLQPGLSHRLQLSQHGVQAKVMVKWYRENPDTAQHKEKHKNLKADSGSYVSRPPVLFLVPPLTPQTL